MNRAIIVVVAAFVGLTIIGILRSYSPIPLGDDWVSYLGFYTDLLDGNYSAWFAQEFGHRPILPRVLVWLDIRYFRGRFVFLIAANFIMLCGIIAILIACLRRLTSESSLQFVIAATICIASVSWMHFADLLSGNGLSIGNFFMAVLLPLLAFYWLARAQKQPGFFGLALLAGFASAWTMANGILVLPLLTILALCIGLKPTHIGMLAVASVSATALFFNLPNGDPSVIDAYLSTLTGNPVGAAQFTLTFLGNPFYYIAAYPLAALHYVFLLFSRQAPGQIFAMSGLNEYPVTDAICHYIAQAAGLILTMTAIIAARRWFASGREAMRGALLMFIFFIIITAIACAAGRLGLDDSGNDYALHFRYTTPPLFAWIALIVLGAPSFKLRGAIGIFVCVTILLIPKQLVPVFGLRRVAVAVEHERIVRAMQAVLRGSDDPEALTILHSDRPDLVRRVAHRLRGTKISIFADAP